MELKSISGYTCYVEDLKKTAEFYKSLGFRFGDFDEVHLVIYLNWFSVQFIQASSEKKEKFLEDANATDKGQGIFINVKVADVDEFYEGIVAKGLKPSSEPRNWPWGNREFVVRDPDGYKLVFFNKAAKSKS